MTDPAVATSGARSTGIDRAIVATGVAVPRRRLPADAVADAIGTTPPVDRMAVAAPDEDAVTLAVAAGADALAGSDHRAAAIERLVVATTTPPLAESALTPRVAAALAVPETAHTSAAIGHTGVAADALLEAATADGPALAIVADVPEGDPMAAGARMGAAGAAFLVTDATPSDAGARVVDVATRTRDAPGTRFRERDARTVTELDITAYDRTTTRELVAGAVDALAVEAAAATDAVRLVLHQPTPDIPRRIAAGLDAMADADRTTGTVVDRLGDAGAATPAVGLAAALPDRDRPDGDGGDAPPVTVLGTFASGASATALALVGTIPTAARAAVTTALDGGESIGYPAALRARGVIGDTEVAGGGAHVSLPAWQRSVPARYRLAAGRCRACEAVAFPPEGACPACGDRSAFAAITLSRTATVVAVTTIGRGGAPPEFVAHQRRGGPYAVAVLEAAAREGPGEARFPAMLTDCDPAAPAVGDRVVARFRRLYTPDVPRYGLKFVPVGDEPA